MKQPRIGRGPDFLITVGGVEHWHGVTIEISLAQKRIMRIVKRQRSLWKLACEASEIVTGICARIGFKHLYFGYWRSNNSFEIRSDSKFDG